MTLLPVTGREVKAPYSPSIGHDLPLVPSWSWSELLYFAMVLMAFWQM